MGTAKQKEIDRLLRDLLGCEVDVVSERGLNPRIRERVLREAVAL